MDKNAIKKYAVWARRELIERVSQRAMIYGITAKDAGDPSAESVNGYLLSQAEKRQRQALIRNIKEKGYEQVMEEVAYTWFNRFAALRFMEVNGYLPSHIRVFTNDAGEFKPQILAEAIHLDLDGLDMNRVYELESANKSEELFKYLLIVQCNALNSILPGMFQRIDDYTELLLPDYLLREGNVIEQMVTTIPEEDWTDQVQIIGWLYQYYISEKKDNVFAALKKNIKISKENIPAATQLFTPDWIVHYLVENSLGRLWIKAHPNDALKSTWKYYLNEAKQEPEVEAKLAEIWKEYARLKPEEIRVIDPCCGSGHIICVLFDVLVQIYEDYGYTAREAAQSIVRYNLYGLDIDPRAVQLAYFSVMMKARQYDRRFFSRKIYPMVYSPEGYPEGLEFGSLITVKELENAPNFDNWGIFDGDYELAQNRWNFRYVLSQKYHVVVTNPPYMGASNMSETLAEYVKKNYPESKGDLFACFIERGFQMTEISGFESMITMESWMFLSSFEKLRTKLVRTKTINTLIHMPYLGKGGTSLGINFGTDMAVIQNRDIKGYVGIYDRIAYYETNDEGIPFEFPTRNEYYKQTTQDNFIKIPGAPVAYWVSDKFREMFDTENLSQHYDVKAGICTGKNDSFILFWHEIDISRCSIHDREEYLYTPHNKGGEYRKWYGNREYVLKYSKTALDAMAENAGFRHDGKEYYFMPHIGWSKITSGKSSFRFFEQGFTFDSAGLGLFSLHEEDYRTTLALLNSKIIEEAIALLNPTLNVTPIIVKKLPYVISQSRIDDIVENNIMLSKADWDSFETSWDFQNHYLIPMTNVRREMLSAGINLEDGQKAVNLLSECYIRWERKCEDRFQRMKQNEEELNRIFIKNYGLGDELTPDVEEKDVTVRKADLQRDIRSLISFAVGCMFGRYSLDYKGLAYGGGTWDDSKYVTFQPDKDNIIPICDDEYFEDDIVGRFIKFVEIVYGKNTLEENLHFIADALSGKGSSREVIRNYFINGFYKDHLKVYQKRPIYWLFDSGKKNGFKCLIYMHRYQPDTIARIRTDYVHEQQSRYRTAIADLEQRFNGASTSERVKLNKQLATLHAQAEEIQVYEEKIHHLADQMIKIDLDDGVKINYAKFQDVLAKIK